MSKIVGEENLGKKSGTKSGTNSDEQGDDNSQSGNGSGDSEMMVLNLETGNTSPADKARVDTLFNSILEKSLEMQIN